MNSYHYFGNDHEYVPQDAQDVIVDPSVPDIPAEFCFFRFRQLVAVDLSEGLQTIGRLAFGWCNLLTQIEIPASVTRIEEGAFESCISLETVILQEDASSCLLTIGERAFNCCEALDEITIPSSVKIIQDCAFRRCTSMAQVSFRDGLKVIRSGSFQECAALERVCLPRTVETLGSEAFRECSSLWEVQLLSEGLGEIGNRAFYGCCNLSVVKMASSRLMIPHPAIFGQAALVSFTGVKIIGEYAFCGCEGLTSIALPPSVTDVERGAFQDCSNLVSVELSADSCTATNNTRTDGLSIEYFAFYCCELLVNISLPRSAADGEGFGSCTLLCGQYGAANLPKALMHRFDGYPIHRKCYHASVTPPDDLSQVIQSTQETMVDGTDYYRHRWADLFGMTPFHILLSSAAGRHRVDLLHILLFSFPPQVLGWKDSFGMLAIDYCWEYQWNEDTRRFIRMILRRWMVGSIAAWGGLESSQLKMLEMIETFLAKDDEDECDNLFRSLRLKLAGCELWEKASLLELKLWKMEMLKHAGSDDGMGGAAECDREICRIQCGASVVLRNVTEFLSIDPLAVLS
ncbi:MAG: hypothetical protein SGBAC_001883 [Bacillariaceae sp.]